MGHPAAALYHWLLRRDGDLPTALSATPWCGVSVVGRWPEGSEMTPRPRCTLGSLPRPGEEGHIPFVGPGDEGLFSCQEDAIHSHASKAQRLVLTGV